MREFKKVNKIFIKSNNSTTKIFSRYLYCLIPFILLAIIYNLIWGSIIEIINLFKSISISLVVATITQYIFNLIKKEKSIKRIFLEDNILTISIIISLFSTNSNILVTTTSTLVSIIIKNIFKNINLSSSLYGILIILTYSYLTNNLNTPLTNLKDLLYIDTYSNIVTPYGNILSYLLGITYYLSPILSIVAFIYLFHKKSIKYNIVFSYVLTFIFIMLTIGLLNNMNIWYLFFQLTSGNILFLTVFGLTDYQNTPTTGEGQVLYGILMGLITSILRFIVPELSVIITLIIGPILFTKPINKLSFKLKYKKKFYYTMITINIFLVILTTVLIHVMI